MKSITWKQFGVFVVIVVGIILAFAPIHKNNSTDVSVENLAKQIVNKEDHITAEQLGQMIIDGDPGYILLDLRSKEEYNNFHIESAINIPLDSLFTSGILNNLDKQKLVVLYSNGGTHAAQAWILLQQKGIKYSTVLLGGLNYWVDVYSNPEPPSGVYADHDVFRYQFLKSAGSKFLDKTGAIETDKQDVEPPKLKLPTFRKKKKAADEGC